MRPATSIKPYFLNKILGKKKKNLKPFTNIKLKILFKMKYKKI